MQKLESFQFIEKLYESRRTSVFRAYSEELMKNVIIKMNNEFGIPQDQALLYREFEIIRSLTSSNVIKAYKLIKEKGKSAIALEDVEGETLLKFINNTPLSLDSFFKIALPIINGIADLHKNKIIHRDIKPQNIIISKTNHSVKLIDFNLSSVHEEGSPALSYFEGSMAYIAPEQTGKVNWFVDLRTDFYMLGVTFYEMLSGVLPFTSKDSLELVHAHLAKPPPPLPNFVPPYLESLVFKLLAKNPEERYQTDYGLKKDFEECHGRWLEHNTESISLGKYDVSDQLHIPQKLYGRQPQINAALSVFSQVCEGASKILFIPGESGIGKSSFVNELYGPISLTKGVFITGKFDQFKRNIPYHAFQEACESLVKYFLGINESDLLSLKNKLLQELNGQGKAIIDVIPCFDKLLGPQPELPPVSVHEAHARFSSLFQKSLHVLVSKETPLVLFLDDLQWVDSSSLDLIKNLSQGISYFLILGAYRSNEVDAAHPLMLTIQELERAGSSIEYIKLPPLGEDDVSELLNDTLRRKGTETGEISKIIYKKTEGNPFFVNQLLKFIYQKKLLVFDQENLKWRWDLIAIEGLNISENVVELVLKRSENLPSEAKKVLGIAAYLGSSFDMHSLLKISHIDPDSLNSFLNQICELGFLQKIGHESAGNDLKKLRYLFSHDRIQQAATTFIPLEEGTHLHLMIGLLLQEENLAAPFEILFQFNQCLNLIKQGERRKLIEIAQMNLNCARQAKESESYAASLGYAEAGLDLLSAESWNNPETYALYFGLSQERAGCLYLLSRREEAEKDFFILLEKAKTPMDYADTCSIFSSLYLYAGSYDKSIEVVKKAFDMQHLKFKLKPSSLDILKEFLKIKYKKLSKKTSELDTYYPDKNNPEFHSILKLFENAYIYSIVTNKENLNFYISLKAIQLGFTYGFSPDLAPNLFALAYFFSLIGQKRECDETLILAKRLLSQCTSKFAIGSANFLYAFFFAQWEESIQHAIDILQMAYRANIEGGYIHFAVNTIGLLNNFQVIYGRQLDEILISQKVAIYFYNKHHFAMWSNVMKIWNSLTLKLRFDDVFDIAELEACIAKIHENGDPTTMATYSAAGTSLLYFLEDYERAIEFSKICLKTTPEICKNWFSFRLVEFCGILSQFHLRGKDALKQALDFKKRLAPYSEKTSNFQSLNALLMAKIYQYTGQVGDAILSFQKAINFAHQQNHAMLITAAQEESALFYEQLKKPKIAQYYMLEAYSTYLNWGCLFKTNMIEKRYGHFIKQAGNLEVTITTKRTTSSTSSATNLDVYSIIKANQALASEIVLEPLLDKMMRVLIETSGAQRCVFITQRRNQLSIQAEGNIDAATSTQIRQIEDSSLVPYSLIFSVFRGSEPIVLRNLQFAHAFNKDPYFSRTQLPLSLLGMPIINQGKTIGVLYLENYLTPHAFTTQQIQVLNFLSTQAAISLEHAHIYSSSGRFVPQEFLKLLNKQNITEVEPGDKTKRYMTLLFCDIREFTKIIQSLSSDEVFDFVNTFLSIMEPPITSQGGFIDKYMGDAIMALFQEKADNALIAAIEMTKQLEKANIERKKAGKMTIRIGIGLNSGVLTLGMLGSDLRIEGSVIGDTVNTAARIENLNKIYGTTLLIGSNMKNSIVDLSLFHLRLIDDIMLRGKSSKTEIWEVLDVYSEQTRHAIMEMDPLFQESRKAFNSNNISKAVALLKDCLKLVPDDPVVTFFLRRCQNLEKKIEIKHL